MSVERLPDFALDDPRTGVRRPRTRQLPRSGALRALLTLRQEHRPLRLATGPNPDYSRTERRLPVGARSGVARSLRQPADEVPALGVGRRQFERLAVGGGAGRRAWRAADGSRPDSRKLP